MTLVLPLHAAATLFMTGVIWFVQVVHYPLFAEVGDEGFPAYAAAHSRRTAWVVVPPMLLELVTGLLLLARRPTGVGAGAAWVGMVLLAAIWLSTALLQVPRHQLLGAGFDIVAWRALVASNWVRTLAWTARAGLVLLMLAGSTG